MPFFPHALQVSEGDAFMEQPFAISGSSVEEIIQKMRIMHLASLIKDFLLQECLSWNSTGEVMSRLIEGQRQIGVIKIFWEYFKCGHHEHFHLKTLKHQRGRLKDTAAKPVFNWNNSKNLEDFLKNSKELPYQQASIFRSASKRITYSTSCGW